MCDFFRDIKGREYLRGLMPDKLWDHLTIIGLMLFMFFKPMGFSLSSGKGQESPLYCPVTTSGFYCVHPELY